MFTHKRMVNCVPNPPSVTNQLRRLHWHIVTGGGRVGTEYFYILTSGLKVTLRAFVCWDVRCTALVLVEDVLGRFVRRTFYMIFLTGGISHVVRNYIAYAPHACIQCCKIFKYFFSPRRRGSCQQNRPYAGDETFILVLGSCRMYTGLCCFLCSVDKGV